VTTEQSTADTVAPVREPKPGRIKCVVWDLDNTLWDGVLLEDEHVTVRPDVVAQIRRLDELGILHSVASRNDHDLAMARLREEGLAEYFLYPQISWNPKSAAIERIAKDINIGLDAIAFVDDQPFERAEVGHVLPDVTTVDVVDLAETLASPDFRPRFVTDESRQRRDLYRSAVRRDEAQEDHVGTSDEFLATLDMHFTVTRAQPEDLQRAEELTVRTNQLNSTGRTYSYDELEHLSTSPDHLLLVASLSDRYGGYGKIGLALVERGTPYWHLRMMLMSCRVMARGVGTVLLNHIMTLARDEGAGLRADFVETGRNRMMYVTYAFAGFTEASRDGDHVVLQSDLDRIQPVPDYLTMDVR
jgi:FkbH-like protein